MSRLTTRNSLGHIVLEVPVVCQRCGERDYNPVNESGDLIAGNLLAYEDTDLTPERCAELAKAEREGRLVVLPLKHGDTIWVKGIIKGQPITKCHVNTFSTIGEDSVMAWVSPDEPYPLSFEVILTGEDSEIGKSAFLTREAAEAVLHGKDGDSGCS